MQHICKLGPHRHWRHGPCGVGRRDPPSIGCPRSVFDIGDGATDTWLLDELLVVQDGVEEHVGREDAQAELPRFRGQSGGLATKRVIGDRLPWQTASSRTLPGRPECRRKRL